MKVECNASMRFRGVQSKFGYLDYIYFLNDWGD